MAKILGRATISLNLTIELSEDEARALDALVGYGDDAFIKAFYELLGKNYMQPHEKGLRELFTTIRKIVPPFLQQVDAARKTFEKS